MTDTIMTDTIMTDTMMTDTMILTCMKFQTLECYTTCDAVVSHTMQQIQLISLHSSYLQSTGGKIVLLFL